MDQKAEIFRDAPALMKDEAAQYRFCDCGFECYQGREVGGSIVVVVVRISVHAFRFGCFAVVLVGLQ